LILVPNGHQVFDNTSSGDQTVRRVSPEPEAIAAILLKIGMGGTVQTPIPQLPQSFPRLIESPFYLAFKDEAIALLFG
jgi:hypothetical protein